MFGKAAALLRQLTSYTLHTGKLTRPVTFAVVSDLHDEPYDDLWPLIAGADALLIPGDVSNRYTGQYSRGLAFLKAAADQMPVFFSPGNHETRQKDYRGLLKAVAEAGATVLVNRFTPFGECVIGGWYDPAVVGEPDPMDAFEKQPGCKVLLCHKPDHYIKYLRNRQVDLVVAGHAHGGQIRIGRQGLYAPGQFFFPKYTKGVVDGRMIISAGAGNPSRFPRWHNPCEVLKITLD